MGGADLSNVTQDTIFVFTMKLIDFDMGLTHGIYRLP